MKKYFSFAASLRVSIPPENAKKILNFLRKGQLNFISGNLSISTENEKIRIHCNNNCTLADKIVYATGSPRSLNEIDSPLISYLVKNGLAIENKFGGLDVCKINYGLLDTHAQISKNIFAIGELTSGCFLFTSSLDIIVRHAHACADRVVAHIKLKQANENS